MRARGRREIPEGLLVCAIVMMGGQYVSAQTGHEHHAAVKSDPVVISGLKVPDTMLVNQRGEKIHFYSDLIRSKVVAINTVFTTCTTICPLMGANFAKLRKLLNERGGEGVNLISISIDPSVD